MDPVYKRNGLPDVPDFHGGDGNFTSVSYMAIGESPMQTLATMIFDGVLDRFPRLMIGVIEQGASWLPGWMRAMDSAAGAFVKNEARLQRLSLKPSEFVARQVRVTPYPHEDTGWIIANSGEGICMFSSDYPHIEGGRAPLKRFDAVARRPRRRGDRPLLLRQLHRPHGERTAMTDTIYATGRVFLDADSHVVETEEWLAPYTDPALRSKLRPLDFGKGGGEVARKALERAERRAAAGGPAFREGDTVMSAKGWTALGAFDTAERTRGARPARLPPPARVQHVRADAVRVRATTSTCSTAGPPRSPGRWSTSAATTTG